MPITTEVASSIPVEHHKPNRNDKMRNQKKKIYQTFGTVTKWIRKIVVTDTNMDTPYIIDITVHFSDLASSFLLTSEG
jgi:hypothetical protein